MKKKKAVSLMLSYVLLIVMAISVAGAIYAWLKIKTDIEPVPKCPSEVSLIIQDYSCNSLKKMINITVRNKGLFSLDGYYIIGTDNEGISFPLKIIEGNLEIEGGKYLFDKPLKPNELNNKTFSYNLILDNLKKIQIEPFKIEEGEVVLCDNAIISQEVSCNVV